MLRTTIESQLIEMSETATSDFKHPLLTTVKFIFADDKPNGNNQGIAYDDFDSVMQSAIDMPIKMRFLGEAGAGGHSGSVTIGHIRGMEKEDVEDGSHRLIADGILYTGEYPEEVEFLKTAYAAGKAPGASWEIDYKDAKQEGLTSWLKGIVTRAATFVRNPAYGTRTALLALASNNNITDEELSTELLAIAKEISPKIPVKGGSNKVEEEIKKLQAELEAKNKEITNLLAEKETLTTAKAELETKISEQTVALAEIAKAKLISERTVLAAEAGLKIEPADALAKKQEIWASMNEDAFAGYLEDLKAVAVKAPTAPRLALAGRGEVLPRPGNPSEDGSVGIDDMKATFRALNRLQ